MTKCMAKELGPHGIRVNCVRPTAMKTNIFDSMKDVYGDFETFAQPLVAGAPIPGFLNPADTAELILFLCGPKASMITGEDVAIDGGFTIA